MAESKRAVVRKGDLTEGGIVSKLTLFALPLIAGNIVNQLYNVADSVVVGNFVGSDALAAVGVCFSVMMCFNALFFGLSMGAGILIAQCFGAKRQKQLQDAVNTSFTLTLILGAAITVLGALLSRSILSLMQTPENILEDSTTYLSIIFFATIGNMIYNMGSGILRGRFPLAVDLFDLLFGNERCAGPGICHLPEYGSGWRGLGHSDLPMFIRCIGAFAHSSRQVCRPDSVPASGDQKRKPDAYSPSWPAFRHSGNGLFGRHDGCSVLYQRIWL